MVMRNGLILAGAMALAACAEPKPEPVVASSTASPGYAERFPERLANVKKTFGDQEREAHELTQKFSGYPGRAACRRHQFLQ
jgi:hypothetical protein